MHIIKLGNISHTKSRVIPLWKSHSIRFAKNHFDWIPESKLDLYREIYHWCNDNLTSLWDILISHKKVSAITVRSLELHIDSCQEALMAKLKWENSLENHCLIS
jgi:hypothetical protein